MTISHKIYLSHQASFVTRFKVLVDSIRLECNEVFMYSNLEV